MKRRLPVIVAAMLAVICLPVLSAQAKEVTAKPVLAASGVKGGLIITIGVTK